MAAANVPAWKRLGLKLKQPAASDSPNGSSPSGQHNGTPVARFSGNKRKTEQASLKDIQSSAKKARTNSSSNTASAPAKKKSVSFGDTPTKNGTHPPARKDAKAGETTSQKKSKGPAKKQTPASTDLRPALDYLRQWSTAREAWKFNKNHQSTLIRHAFEPQGIPPADIGTFCKYIRDLKGFVRTRLQETAMEIRTEDESGAEAFPEGTMDLDDKQTTYESILRDFLGSSQAGSKRKAFNEADYVTTSTDGQVIIQRIVKRMRAEMVLDELSDSGDTDMSTTSSIGAAETTNGNSSGVEEREKKIKLNDGTGKRRRKLRTADVEDSSSSEESESDSDSDTSSSDDSSSDEEEGDAAKGGAEDDTSSSSSSSSSEDESRSEDDSEEEL